MLAGLIGVFISVTTIPAAADIDLSLAFQSWDAADGATLQLVLNLVLLIVVGALALRGQRLLWRDRGLAQNVDVRRRRRAAALTSGVGWAWRLTRWG